MKLAERYGFKIQTFTHILEGYKLADKMSAHGVAGSTFADWWAYKYEVNDAIPYNAAIMMNEGVKVSINSDDAEMSRRLNQEAAKTVKYGNVTEEEAWNFVTLNPAKNSQPVWKNSENPGRWFSAITTAKSGRRQARKRSAIFIRRARIVIFPTATKT